MQMTVDERPEASTGNKLLAVDKVTFGGRYDTSRRTVDNWIADGLPILKLSERAVRIPLEEADEWIRQRFFQQRRKQAVTTGDK